ncbi:TPA: MurR/RpiR family transcriptional regulator, partial [Escherichia coli]|nr:MurR/RpiR family transcriptional regulator [Escherichia coli]
MNNITVKSLIQSNYPTLHQAEKKVADYILSHAHEVVNYSVTELSEKSHASEATIVRTCKKLGYQGYYHLKIALAKEVINPDNSYPENTDFSDITSLATFLLKKQAEDLIQSTQFFNAEVLESILKLLANCDTIFFFAAGNSNPLAVYGAYKFSQLGLKTVVHVSPEMQINAAYSMGKRDLAIGISNSGSTNLMVDI